MGLLTPGLGLFFWMFLVFAILLFVLGKFGWPVVLKMMRDREENIKLSLEAADRAKEEMQQLQCNNELLLKQAQEERDEMLKQTKLLKEKIIEEANQSARVKSLSHHSSSTQSPAAKHSDAYHASFSPKARAISKAFRLSQKSPLRLSTISQ